ncbi:MAG: endonuclease/exonuclease/phosphatase family protein, partial [Bacteroidota bacterium]
PLLKGLFLACSLLASPGLVRGQAPLTAINTPYVQNFNQMATTGTAGLSTLPAGWKLAEAGTNADTTYATSTGSSNAGNTYSLGTAGTSDRALGGLQSGSLIPTIGAGFINNTGAVITQFQIAYTGEQWRLGTAGRQDRLDFQYSLDATSLTSGTWINQDLLDFSGPVSAGTAGLLDGNAAANRSVVSFTLEGLSIENGATFWIRWNDFNATGSDDALAIDDFSLTPTGNVVASLTFAPTSVAFGNVNVNESALKSYVVTGINLTDSIQLSAPAATLTISVDSLNFGTVATLPAAGGKVFVRFAPTTPGVVTGAIAHSSASLQKNLSVTGNGFDQASNIIPIAQARAQAVGTLVTVAGRVTVSNQFGSPSYVQDATGGIPVFLFALSNAVSIGDSVIVTGPIGTFNSQVQISGNGIFFNKVNTSPRVIEPKIIALDQLAAFDGQLVTVENAEFVTKTFVLLPDNNQKIAVGNVEAELRVDGDTDLPGLLKPQSTTNLTGVVGLFKTTAQLLPRFQADVPGATPSTSPADSIAKDKTFDLVTWNVEWFNSPVNGPTNEPLQFANVKKIILSLDADVYAFEEIANDAAFAALTAQLPGYKSFCSDTYSYSFDPQGIGKDYQKICFLYKTATVDSISTKVLLKDLFEAVRAGNGSLLPNYPGEPASFWASGRLPYMFEFNATIDGQSKKIHLVDIHARANSGTDVSRYDRRKYDVELLKDTLDALYGSDNLIIVGDYNDDVDVSVVNNLPSSFEEYVKDTTNYQVLTLPLSKQDYYSYVPFASFLDHITISNELINSYLPNSIRIHTPFDIVSNYLNTTSDHLPVSARFQFAPEVCPPAVSVAVNMAGAVCTGSPLTFVAQSINGGMAPAYQWLLNGQPIIGATDSIYTSSTLANGDKIRVQLTSSAACALSSGTVTSDSLVVEIKNGAVAHAGADKTVYKGFFDLFRTATLTGAAIGGQSPYQYKWNTGATTAQIKVSPAQTTTYTFTVTDATGCASTDQVLVKVEDVRCGSLGLSTKICYQKQSYCTNSIIAAIMLNFGATLGNCQPTATITSVREGLEEVVAAPILVLTAAPNPVSSSTVLTFSVPTSGFASLDLYDVQGTQIKNIFAGQAEAGKQYHFEVEGSKLAQGLYISRLATANGVQTIKLLVVK